jgi:UPF0716 protein FxsA
MARVPSGTLGCVIWILFLVVPTVELMLLIEVGKAIGTLATIGLIVGTGVLGATLARHHGLSALSRMRGEMDAGRLPADALVDGMLILVAAALLITPGVLTDAVGFLLLIPLTRMGLKRWLRHRLERAMEEGRANVHVHFGGEPSPRTPDEPPGRGKVIDQDDVP